MNAGQIMRTDYMSLHPQDSALRAAELMIEHRRFALPVVNETRQLVGTLDITDLLRLFLPAYLDAVEDLSFLPGDLDFAPGAGVELAALTVGELCARHTPQSPAVCSALSASPAVAEDEALLEVARLFVRERAHKCIVVRDGQVVGVIHPQHLLAALIADATQKAAAP